MFIYPRELIKTLETEYGLKLLSQVDGVYYVEGEAYPIQILETKKLTDENLFIKNLRSGLSPEESARIAESYKKIRALDTRNIYLDRIIQANRKAFKEAAEMSDVMKELFFEVCDENGWLKEHDNLTKIEELKKVARNFLMLGVSTEKVSKANGLSIDVVKSLA